MKFVFIAHSHTLALTSLGVIEYLNIDAKDIIFVCTRHFDANYFPHQSIVQRWDVEYDLVNEIRKYKDKRQIYDAVSKVDDKILNNIGEKYKLYVPHLGSALFLLMYNHPLCVDASFVQEGAYTSPMAFVNKVSLYRKFRIILRNFLKYGHNRFYGLGCWYFDGVLQHQKSLDAYAIYGEFFCYLKGNIIIVKWPELHVPIESNITGPVFIFDGFVKNGLSDSEYYLEQCNLMIEKFHGNTNFLKFHPAQSLEECDKIRAMFRSKGILYEEMDARTPFELYILQVSHMTVVGMGSSLLYYAKRRGHDVICCDSWMMSCPQYNMYHKCFPLFHQYFDDVEEVIK